MLCVLFGHAKIRDYAHRRLGDSSFTFYAHSHSIAYMLLLPHGLLESRGEAILKVLRKDDDLGWIPKMASGDICLQVRLKRKSMRIYGSIVVIHLLCSKQR